MSGICGIVSLTNQAPRLDLLERMMQSLTRLGPDGSGTWQDERAALGHRMMWVTPESRHERLPLFHAGSGVAVTADARLDNREDLLRELQLPAAREAPDSELILAAYQRWGSGCADRLLGDFALAIWDARNQQLHCITDPMGIRPLFYRELAGQYFAFASEVRALLALGDRPVPLNQRRLAMLGVSTFSVYLEPESTCFEGIFRIPAATIHSIGGARRTATEYWQPDARKRLRFRSDDECREAFQEVFFKAVKARLRSVFPVASLLSGGLDSSAIVSAASRLLKENNRNLITLSSVPMAEAQGRVVDEREFIDLFRGYVNLEMHDVSAPGCGPFDDLENLVETASLISYSYQHFLYTALARTARERTARVILDGDGGELSASCYARGYMAELMLTGRWKSLVGDFKGMATDRAAAVRLIKSQLLRPLLPYAVLKKLNRHNQLGIMLDYPIRADYVHDVLGRDADRIRDLLLRLPKEYPNHRRNMVQDILLERRDLRQRSHAGFVDYQSVRFSYPFLDKRVLEFSLAVDGRFKYRNGKSRQLLRLGMQDMLPEKIRSRTSKVPFSPDYHVRYVDHKAKAFDLLRDFDESGRLKDIVDFNRIWQALEATPIYQVDNPMRVDRDPQFTIPYALYLCYFLATFGN